MSESVVRVLIMGLFAALIATFVIREHFIALSLSSVKFIEWDTLLYKLRSVRAADIRALARMSEENKNNRTGNDWDRLASRIGAPDQVDRLVSNADVLVELAYRTQDWSRGEGQEIIDNIVSSNARLKAHARYFALMSALAIKRGRKSQVRYIASAYCCIVRDVLTLYRASHSARVNQLATACSWSHIAG